MKEQNYQFYSTKLYGYDKTFTDFYKLYKIGKFPKSLMLSGVQGIGKFTLIKHFLTSIFDSKNYYLEKKEIMSSSNFSKCFFLELNPNIVYLNGLDGSSKIDSIRNLKDKINKSTTNNQNRFVLMDNIEMFSTNSLNALLKLIEEPTKLNYFVFINNKKKPVLETIHSRCNEFKVILNEEKRISIINSLINDFKIEPNMDFESNVISPGTFLNFNRICEEEKINLNTFSINNINNLFSLYKKEKKIVYIDMIKFIIENHFSVQSLRSKNSFENFSETKISTLKLINDFVTFNINQKTLLNTISKNIENVS